MYSIECSEEWDTLSSKNIQQAKEKLMYDFVESWKEEIQSKSKLDLYSTLKTGWGTEGYIKANINKSKRSLICQARIGTLMLMIEKGRYYKIPRHLRICELCKNEVEDLPHFLFRCASTEKTRIDLLYKYPGILNYATDNDKLLFLSKKPFVMGNYIQTIWQDRETKLSRNVVVCDNSH